MVVDLCCSELKNLHKCKVKGTQNSTKVRNGASEHFLPHSAFKLPQRDVYVNIAGIYQDTYDRMF